MWLSRMNQPDFRTVNRFRKVVFRETVEELEAMGLIDLREYFADGINLEANANKYSFVWKKSREKYRAKLQEKVKAILDEDEAVQGWEDELYGDRDLHEVEGARELSSAELQQVADKLNAVLHKEPDNKEAKKLKN